MSGPFEGDGAIPRRRDNRCHNATMSSLEQARAALERGDWQRALDLLAHDGASAEALELRAQAAYGQGDLEGAVAAWEDLYAVQVAAGDPDEAARAAAMIALHFLIDTGLMAPVRGWLRRAERLVDGCDEVPVLAIIAMVRTYERFMCGDPEGSREQAALAVELGERLGVRAAVIIGRTATARLRIADGAVEEGLGLLDEIAVELMSGDVDALTTGMMYCELICAAQGLAHLDRAREWTEVMERWRHGVATGGINGRCRVHRAELLKISGPCDLAEAEALGACAELRPWLRREFGWPLVELGNIRLRRGDLAGAEEAFIGAHEHAWSPHPGLALLRLAQGDRESAVSLIADAIEHPLDMPSKEQPPFGDLRLAPLLDAQAEIAAAVGDADTVRQAAEGLQSIAAKYATPSLVAGAALARGRAALLSGDLPEAMRACGIAVATWTEVGAPYETAAARVVLGEAHRVRGSLDRARMEWQAARAAFHAFGAAQRASEVDRLLDDTRRPAAPVGDLGGVTATFKCQGRSRAIGLRGLEQRVPDLKGFRYLDRLLSDPGREFHVLDLVAVELGSLPGQAPVGHHTGVVATGGDAALPAIDDQARAAYRRRLAEVDEDIEEASRMNDLGRLALAERDRDYLMAELAHAVGLGGRHRMVGGTAERARTSVTRSLRYALVRLTEQHPDLGAHLDRAVRTGMYCSYLPDPVAPVRWDLGTG
ncbi:MAG: hypothetical protein JWO11_2562 [Nocardioides sp.]|nr:hypothetical protein [Nocardioides sp.]